MKCTSHYSGFVGYVAMAILVATMATATQESSPVPIPVNYANVVRAESDLYFGRYITRRAFGKFFHERTMTPIDKQEIVRMTRDTLYSFAIFDLDASPIPPQLIPS